MPTRAEERDPVEIVLEHLSVLRLEPGDVLVLRVPRRLTAEQYERLRESLTHELGGHKAVVLEDGAELGVVRQVQS